MSDNSDHQEKNNERLLALKDIHRGQRAFIIGNGPSMTVADLDRLKDEITFASNRIYLAFDETTWRPTYYNMCDKVVARENRETVMNLDLTKVLANSVRPVYQDDPRAIFLNPKLSADDQADVVGWDLHRGQNAGHSVVNLALKIAYWMGIREVYVIGCDHSFAVPDTKTGETVAHNDVIRSAGERNHFHPDYRKPGEEWTVPKLDTMAEEFAFARQLYESEGGTIKNASRFTKLDVWECVDFDAIVPSPQSR